MWGSDTLTIVVSRISMNAASVTETAISQGLARGRHCWSWALSLTRPRPMRRGLAGDLAGRWEAAHQEESRNPQP